MANFQLRKTNDKLTLQMCFFFSVNVVEEVLGLFI